MRWNHSQLLDLYITTRRDHVSLISNAPPPPSGVNALRTVRISQAAAAQRTGRAGRTGPGVCYRLWTEGDNKDMPEATAPEILEADLAPLMLNLSAW